MILVEESCEERLEAILRIVKDGARPCCGLNSENQIWREAPSTYLEDCAQLGGKSDKKK